MYRTSTPEGSSFEGRDQELQDIYGSSIKFSELLSCTPVPCFGLHCGTVSELMNWIHFVSN